MKTLLAVSIGVGLFASSVANAQAAPQCGDRDAIVKALSTRFQESRQGMGIASGQKSVLELFVSAQGTWTLTLTGVRGQSCIIGSGENWQTLPILAAGTDS